MANLKEIKRKIKSVVNTQKTTNAMKLVSTAKLKKAEELARRSKIYASKLEEILEEISYKFTQFGIEGSIFFKQNDAPKIIDLIFITSDKGLCGGFNIKTIKLVLALKAELESQNVTVRLRAIGKVGVEFCRFQKIELFKSYLGLSSSPSYEKACEVINEAVSDFEAKKTQGVILVHNGYKNMISQELSKQTILPVKPLITDHVIDTKSTLEFEPEEISVLDELIKRYFEYGIYYALLDSLAAEHAARRAAMDNASNNAKERVAMLNLAYNKARQESITTELIEIISGVESMKIGA